MYIKVVCKLCKKRGKIWQGDDPICAFDNGIFNSDNWNCATMNKLRMLVSRYNLTHRDDMSCGSIGVLPFEGDDNEGYIVMTWYKERCQTGSAMFVYDDMKPQVLTEEIALEAIRCRK